MWVTGDPAIQGKSAQTGVRRSDLTGLQKNATLYEEEVTKKYNDVWLQSEIDHLVGSLKQSVLHYIQTL